MTRGEPPLDPALFAVAGRHIEGEEGRVAHAYRDHLDYLTIGIGRLIDDRRGGRLLAAEIDLMLANDIVARVGTMQRCPARRRVADDPVRATTLPSMSFQLGMRGLSEFTTTLAHVTVGRFDEVADAMRDSLWAAQTPARHAGRVHDAHRGIVMSERDSLRAFCVLVAAICYLATVAATLARAGRYALALGFGGLITGLVGVLGASRPKTPLSTISRGRSAPANEGLNP